MSVKEIDPGRELARSARLAAVTVAACTLLLLPVAWAVTKGLLPMDRGSLAAECVMGVCAFAARRLTDPAGGRGELPRTLLHGAAVYALLLLLSAAVNGGRPAPGPLLPFAGAAVAGYAAEVLTKINKKAKTNNRRRKRYYR